MIIKNNKVQVIFISCFYSIVLILLISFGYFLGFEKTIVSLLLYMISILVVIMSSLLVIVLFTRCCNSYTKISADKIIVYKNDKILKEVDAKVINIVSILVFGISYYQIQKVDIIEFFMKKTIKRNVYLFPFQKNKYNRLPKY